MLLIAATLFVRTLHNLRHAEVGFNRENLVMFGLQPKPRRYSVRELTHVVQRIEERLVSLPGVRSGTFARLPIGGLNVSPIYAAPGRKGEKTRYEAAHNAVGPNYFATLEVPLLPTRNTVDLMPVIRGTASVRALAAAWRFGSADRTTCFAP